jgi:hypothetical protein
MAVLASFLNNEHEFQTLYLNVISDASIFGAKDSLDVPEMLRRGEAYLSLTGRVFGTAAIDATVPTPVTYTAKVALPSVGGVPLAALVPTKIVTLQGKVAESPGVLSALVGLDFLNAAFDALEPTPGSRNDPSIKNDLAAFSRDTPRDTLATSVPKILQRRFAQLARAYPNTCIYVPPPLDYLYIDPDAPELEYASAIDVHFPLTWNDRRLVPDLVNMMHCCGFEYGAPIKKGALVSQSVVRRQSHGPLDGPGGPWWPGYTRVPLVRLPVGSAVARVGMYESVFPMPCNSSYTHCRLLHNIPTLPIIGASTGWAETTPWSKNIGEEDELRDVVVIHVEMHYGALMAELLALVNMMPSTNFVFVNYRLRADDQREWLCADSTFFAPHVDDSYEQLREEYPKTIVIYRGSTPNISRAEVLGLNIKEYENFYHGDEGGPGAPPNPPN